MHFRQIGGWDLSQAGQSFAVDLSVRLLNPGNDDLSKCLELLSRKFSDSQISKVSGKNSGDSSCDSCLRQEKKEQTPWSKIRDGMLQKRELGAAVVGIEIVREIQVQNLKGAGTCFHAE